MTSFARWILEHGRVVRVNRRDRVTFLTVATRRNGEALDYYDVKAFGEFRDQLHDGQAVELTGDLQRAKPRDGSKRWTTELIAREVRALDDDDAPNANVKRQGPPVDDVPPPGDDDVPF